MLNFTRRNARFLRDNSRWLGGGFLLMLFSSFGQTFFIGMSGNDLRETFVRELRSAVPMREGE